MLPGRNDPCPCGSGRKFKKCHGAAADGVARPDISPAATWQALDHELIELLLRFSKGRGSTKWIDDAMDAYVGPDGQEIHESELQLAVPWAFFNWSAPPQLAPVAETFRRTRGRNVASNLRALLDAQLLAYCSPWYVERVEPGVGLDLVDLLTDEQRFVHERLGSTSVEPGLVLLGRVADLDEISLLLGSHPQSLRAQWVEPLLKEARRRCGVRTRGIAPDKMRDPAFQTWLINAWRRIWAQAEQPPRIRNTDGDDLSMTTDHLAFDPADREALLQSLMGLAGAEEPSAVDEGDDAGETEIVIARAGNRSNPAMKNTIVGQLLIGDGRLRLVTNSTRRADDLRRKVLARAGNLVRFRIRDETSVPFLLEKAQEAAKRGDPLPPRPIPTAEQAAALRQYKERHYATWPDIALPALGGLTPRAATRNKRGRAQVERLLNDFARAEASLPEAERFDVGKLRKDLGLY